MRCIFLLTLVLLPAALAAQRPLSPRAVAGCYALVLDPWTPALPDTRYPTPPARIVLDTLPAEGRGAFRVRPAPGTPPGPHGSASWAPLPASSDSLRILWSTGARGVEVRLRAAGGTLRGRAVAFTDEAPLRASAGAVARRLEGCTGALAAGGTPTPIEGVEVRGKATERRPDLAPAAPADPPAVQRVPLPVTRTEEIAAWTLGGLVAWILLHFTGIL
jgi:hypothetical protein